MRAADARKAVQDLGLTEQVAKLVADASPLSDTQRETLSHIFRPNEEGGPRRSRQPDTSDSGRHSHSRG
jgi:hypothetical protein